jgi:hypothetical protein
MLVVYKPGGPAHSQRHSTRGFCKLLLMLVRPKLAIARTALFR